MTQLYAATGKRDNNGAPVPFGDRPRTQRKDPKIRASAKALNIEGVRETKSNRAGPYFEKELSRVGLVAQDHYRLGAEIENRKEAMEQEAHLRHDCFVRRRVLLVVETQNPKPHLRR